MRALERHRRLTALVAAGALLAPLLLVAPAGGQGGGGSGPCIGQTDAAAVPQLPGPQMRFGITPGVETGQLGSGPAPPRTPEDPAQQIAALERLRPPGAPFVLRLHRFFWSDREAGVQRFLELADRYTSRGFLVELQLRYHPDEQQEGDIPAWLAYVRDVVRRFGRNPRVVAIQVTNEVNLTFSPDSSDGAYRGAREALIQGVIAAKEEAVQQGHRHLEIGFNWAYRTEESNERSFWQSLRDQGGPAFVASVDWVGLDAYPGTFFPPAHLPGEERDGMVNAMSVLRECFMPIPGFPASVPIHVEENGWPTGPGRTYERQAEVAETLIRAVHDFRGTYNVSDYRWFNLRDGDSSSQNFQTQYGLMRDDYVEKPAFAVFQRLTAELARRPGRTGTPPGAPPRARPRLSLGLRYSTARSGRRRARCVPAAVSARVGGRDGRLVRRAGFALDRGPFRTDSRAPFGRLVHRRHGGRHGIHSLGVRVLLTDRRRLTLTRRFRACVPRR